MIALAIDPSLTCTGWAACQLEHGELIVLRRGCIRTEPSAKKLRIRKGDDFARRLGEIFRGLRDASFGCDVIASEQPAGSKSAVSAKSLGGVAALVTCLGLAQGRAVEWFQAAEAKLAAAGCKSASKAAVEAAVLAHAPAVLDGVPLWRGKPVKPIAEAIADAVSVAMAWAQQHGWSHASQTQPGLWDGRWERTQ